MNETQTFILLFTHFLSSFWSNCVTAKNCVKYLNCKSIKEPYFILMKAASNRMILFRAVQKAQRFRNGTFTCSIEKRSHTHGIQQSELGCLHWELRTKYHRSRGSGEGGCEGVCMVIYRWLQQGQVWGEGLVLGLGSLLGDSLGGWRST